MDQFQPPAGPPTPHVPEGWKAVWNDQYKEWFYVNIHTKKSQWDKPTAPAPLSSDHEAPPGAPPGYSTGPNDPVISDTKSGLGTNNPYGASGPGGGGSSTESDAALAARLQAEEDARASGHSPAPGSRGQSDGYYQNQSDPNSYPQNPAGGAGGAGGYDSQQLPPRDEKSRGFLGKLLGKGKQSGQQGYGGGGYGGGGYAQQQQGYPQQGYGGGYPPQQQQGYGGYPPQGYYPPQQGYYQQPPRRSGGLGAGGGAALGLGGGLLGGMLLGEAMDGGDGGGDGGGDYGGDGGGDGGGGDGGGGGG